MTAKEARNLSLIKGKESEEIQQEFKNVFKLIEDACNEGLFTAHIDKLSPVVFNDLADKGFKIYEDMLKNGEFNIIW